MLSLNSFAVIHALAALKLVGLLLLVGALAPPAHAQSRRKTEQERMAERPLVIGGRVKPGKGFVFSSADGDFGLALRLRAQFRYTLNAEGEEGEEEELTQSGQIRRARLTFTGHFYGEHNKFKAEFAVSPSDVDKEEGSSPQTSPLLDWYLDFTRLRDLSLRLGQYKVPFNRQRVVSSGALALVDRSIVNAEFNQDRDVGLDIRSRDLFGLGVLRYYAGVFAGEGRNTSELSDFDMMYLARVELLPFGMFKDYSEMDFERLKSPRLSLGLGYGRVQGAAGERGILGPAPTDGGTTDIHTLTWDAVARYAGWSLMTEWAWRDGSRQPGDLGAAQEPRDGIGGTVQLSVLVPGTHLGVAARGSVVRPLGESALPRQTEVGGGVGYFFAQHPFKLQADYFRLTEGALVGHEVRVQLQASY